MDPTVLELRRMMADRYKQARPEERPHVRVCPSCKAPVHTSEVCRSTGLLHDLANKTVIAGTVVDRDKRVFSGGELISAINNVRIKWQAARTAKVSVDADSAAIFQTFVLQRQWKTQRYGILYGVYDASLNQVEVHSIFEPEQVSTETTVDLVDDPHVATVDLVASYLGFTRVGSILTHPPRDADLCILEAKELLCLARDQSRFGDHCVLLTIAPDPQDKVIHAQAWQASQQCVRLFQVGLLSQSSTDPRFVESSEPLEIAQDERDDKGRPVCITKEPATSVDARWMFAPVAVGQFASDIVGNRFVRFSRPGEASPTLGNLRRFLDDPKRKQLPLVEQLRDFHVLVFLALTLFDPKHDMPLIVKAVLAKNKDEFKVFETLIREHLRSFSGGS